MMKTILIGLVVANLAVLVFSASILDYITDPLARDAATTAGGAETPSAASAAETRRNCLCNGPSCICCVDFNLTFVDLGGPGCVRMNYISPDEGIAINVSYGDSLLHSQTVRGPDPAPACLNIFSSIAQMCARFSHLLPTDDGLRGCVMLEPKLLGTTQIELPIGCFRMGPNGMSIAESNADIINEQIPGAVANGAPAQTEGAGDADDDDADDEAVLPGTLGGYSTADILAAVSDSAEEGIALLSNWFGLVQAPAAPGAAAAAAADAAVPNADLTEAPADEEAGATEASA